MKKIFTCTLICFFGFYLPGKTQLKSEYRIIYTETGEDKLGIHQIGRLNTFTAINRVKNSFTSYPVLINGFNPNTTPGVTAEPDNVLKRWLTDGSIQTLGDMTAFSSFTVNSIDNISILFSVPLKKFNL